MLEYVILKTLNICSRTLPLIFFGMLFSEILLRMDVLKKIEAIGKPITKLANLPEICGIAFVTAIFSPTASNAMLQDLRERKVLNEKEVLLSSILSSTLAPFRETFTYHIPVILPMLGIYVGGVYIAMLWLNALVLLMFVIIYGKFTLRNRSVNANITLEEKPPSAKISFKTVALRFTKIGITFIVTTFLILALFEFGFMNGIETVFHPIASRLNLPPSVIPAIITYIASPIVGFSTFSVLLQNNAISENEAVLSLLVGSVFMLPLTYIKYFFPRWISIFGFRLGLLRGLTSLSLVMMTRIVCLIVFIKFFY